MIALIASMASNRVIGKDNKLLWHIPEELQHFKRTTLGAAVIMGRNTYFSIGKALPGRENFVVSYEREALPGATVCTSIPEALRQAQATGKDVFFIGGASIYAQSMSLADTLIISYVRGEYDGDVYFPTIEPRDWREESRTPHELFDVVVYRRKHA